MRPESNRRAACERLLSLTLSSTLLVCTGCGRSHRKASTHPEALVVYPGATRVVYAKWRGTDQLSYRVAVEYPADSVLSYISEQLKSENWRVLVDDYWNPGLPSSQVRGWTQFADARVNPEATVDHWLGEWQNQEGDVAWYSLQYRYPPGDRYTLMVRAGFIPANPTKKLLRPTILKK